MDGHNRLQYLVTNAVGNKTENKRTSMKSLTQAERTLSLRLWACVHEPEAVVSMSDESITSTQTRYLIKVES